MTFIASVLRCDDIFFENLLTKEKLNPLPTEKVNIWSGQAGWEWAREAGPCLIQDLDSVNVSGQPLTTQPGHWGTLETCPSHIAQSTLWLLISIAPATSTRAQLHLDQQNGPNMTWQKPAIFPAVRSLDYFGVSDWIAAPLKKYLRHRRLTWLVVLCDLHPPPSKWLWNERDQFCGFCFGQLGWEICPCVWHHVLQPHLRGLGRNSRLPLVACKPFHRIWVPGLVQDLQ